MAATIDGMRKDDVFLDIETSWDKRITVIGFASEQTGVVQLYGSSVSARNLIEALPDSGRIFTFNGHSFDLPIIKSQLGVNLRERFESHDLMHVGRRFGLRGGQKKIEVQLGISRVTEGISGIDAMNLWRNFWEWKDERALELLLRYNAEDVRGMIRLLEHLESWGWTGD
ncbi:MAG: ribonuclease H-like domain-containing protein [Planctomycetes bacterium]|nr:ribonuclease H-like domain-containing protein [Planctomycetota bacterium]